MKPRDAVRCRGAISRRLVLWLSCIACAVIPACAATATPVPVSTAPALSKVVFVVVAAARACFDLREDAGYRVHVADAVSWVATASGVYDYVLLDSYAGEAIPASLRTVAFFQSVARLLAPGGVVGINIAELDAEGAEVVRALRTVLQPFDCWEAPADGNLMIFAALGPHEIDETTFLRWLDAWDARRVTDVSLRTLVAQRSGSDCARALGPVGRWMSRR